MVDTEFVINKFLWRICALKKWSVTLVSLWLINKFCNRTYVHPWIFTLWGTRFLPLASSYIDSKQFGHAWNFSTSNGRHSPIWKIDSRCWWANAGCRRGNWWPRHGGETLVLGMCHSCDTCAVEAPSWWKGQLEVGEVGKVDLLVSGVFGAAASEGVGVLEWNMNC